MNNIEDLFKESAASLKDHGFDDTDFQRPFSPVSIIYYGDRSRQHHAEMFRDISEGWGRTNAESIKFYSINNTDDHTFVDVVSDQEVTPDNIMDEYTALMESERYSEDSMAVYFVYDSSTTYDEDQFEAWYREIEYFKAIFHGNLRMKSMLIVILDESLRNEDKAKFLKHRLLDLYKSDSCGNVNSHIYDSVFVLSTKRNRRGYECFDPNSPRYENNNMLGNLILLSNTRDNDLVVRNTSLYGNNVPAKTAAHGYIEKPNREIIYVALKIIFEKMIEMLGVSDNKTLNEDELLLALGIKNNTSEIVDSVYEEIKNKLPSLDFKNNLPNYDSSRDSSYRAVNETTLGCLAHFLQMNHFETVRNNIKEGKIGYVSAFTQLIQNGLYASKIVDGIDSIDDVYDTISRYYNCSEGNEVDAVIVSKVKNEIFEQLKPCIKEALSASCEEARETMTAFNELNDAFKNYVAYGIDDEQIVSIEKFYKPRISHIYNDYDKKVSLFKRLMLIGNSTTDMLNVLFAEIKMIFASDEVFRKSYFEELVLRVQSKDENAQELIIEELAKNNDQKILFNSQMRFTKRMEVYFIDEDHKSNTSLIDEINRLPKDDGVERSIFNTSDDDYAESIWFYDCSEEHFDI